MPGGVGGGRREAFPYPDPGWSEAEPRDREPQLITSPLGGGIALPFNYVINAPLG